ncbi:MAG TPA: ABC transporter permease [Candidatus Dormibacteraeota bacterium]|nr:ABC transporter permease [Candidatus Dormibacteraeota bacterium]
MAVVATVDQAVDWESPEQIGLWSDVWRRFRRNRLAVAGAIVVAVLILDALLVPLLAGMGLVQDPIHQDVTHIFGGPSLHHPAGTDYLGRDTLARLMFGARISLSIGILVQGIILAIGGVIGLVSGYFGGRVDNLLMRFTDIWFAFPDLIFVLVLVSVFGPSILSIFVAIALTNWANLARLVRGQVLSIKEKEFIESARAVGSSGFKIMARHLIPNALGPVIVTLTFGIPQAIFLDAALSYLGVGIQPPTPDWGVMVQDGYQAMNASAGQVVFPAIAIAITMLSFTFIGDGLRDALDPRMRR